VLWANNLTFPGLGIARALLAKHRSDPVAIFAGVRSPSGATELQALQSQYPERLFIVAYDAQDSSTAGAAAKVIEEKFGWVDVVVANAGVSGLARLDEVSVEVVDSFFKVLWLIPHPSVGKSTYSAYIDQRLSTAHPLSNLLWPAQSFQIRPCKVYTYQLLCRVCISVPGRANCWWGLLREQGRVEQSNEKDPFRKRLAGGVSVLSGPCGN
jgi:hypothetical protein